MRRGWGIAGGLAVVVSTVGWIVAGFLRSAPASELRPSTPWSVEDRPALLVEGTPADRSPPGRDRSVAVREIDDEILAAASMPVTVRGRLLGLDPDVPWRAPVRARVHGDSPESAIDCPVDVHGSFRVEFDRRRFLVSGAELSLEADSPGYAPVERRIPELDLRGPEPQVRLLVSSAETLRGRVVDSHGRPLRGAHVEVFRLHRGLPIGAPVCSSEAEDDGRFELRVPLEEPAWVVAYESVAMHRRWMTWDELSQETLPAVRPWSFRPGADRTMSDLILEPSATITGRLRRTDGTPMPADEIHAVVDVPGRFRLGNSWVVAREDGVIAHAEVAGSVPGNGEIAIRGLGPFPYWISVHGIAGFRRDPMLGRQRVIAPDEVELTIAEHQLHLFVSSSTGAPVRSFSVAARSEHGSVEHVFQGSEGLLLLETGDWEIEVEALGSRPCMQRVKVEVDRDLHFPLAEGIVHQLELELVAGGSVPEVAVWLKSADRSQGKLPRGLQDGNILRWPAVPAGRYRLNFYDRDSIDPSVPAIVFPEDCVVDISGPESLRRPVECVRGGRLSVVLVEAGTPATPPSRGNGARGDLVARDGALRSTAGLESRIEVRDATGAALLLRFGVPTGSDVAAAPGVLPRGGTLVSQPLAPGRYTVIWRPDSTAPVWEDVRVSVDETTRVELELPR